MMELTHSPQIIMPGMLVIVVAGLTAGELFRKESLFITMLKAAGWTIPPTRCCRRCAVSGLPV